MTTPAAPDPAAPTAPALPPLTAPVKRSVSIEGHRTSVTLEEAFWRELGALAAARGVSRAQLIARIDAARPPDVGLATAIRLVVLDGLRRLP